MNLESEDDEIKFFQQKQVYSAALVSLFHLRI